jgi:hypothetical protein
LICANAFCKDEPKTGSKTQLGTPPAVVVAAAIFLFPCFSYPF